MRNCPDSCGLLVSMTTLLPPHRQLLSGLMAQPLYSGTFPQSVVVAFRPVPHSGATNHKIWGMRPPGDVYQVALDSSHGLGIKPYFLFMSMSRILFLAIKPSNKQNTPLTDGRPSCLFFGKRQRLERETLPPTLRRGKIASSSILRWAQVFLTAICIKIKLCCLVCLLIGLHPTHLEAGVGCWVSDEHTPRSGSLFLTHPPQLTSLSNPS